VGYNPGVSPLSLNFNRFQISWQAATKKTQFQALAETSDDSGILPLDSIAFRFSTADASKAPLAPLGQMPLAPLGHLPLAAPLGQMDRGASAGGRPPGSRQMEGWQTEAWQIVPTRLNPAVGRTWLPVRYPTLATGSVIKRLIQGANITVLGHVRFGRVPTGAWVAARHTSAPLAEIIDATLEHSNNLAAELLGLAAIRTMNKLDSKLNSPPASLEQAATVLERWLHEKKPDGPWHGWRLMNFSGLSPHSQVSPRQMLAVLTLADEYRRQQAGMDLFTLMRARDLSFEEEAGANPTPVRTSRLRKASPSPSRISGPRRVVHLQAKTGTMAYARCLAGMMTLEGNKGRRLGFAIFINDTQARRAYDATFNRLDPDLSPAIRQWLRRASGLRDALLEDWAARWLPARAEN
jgi:D-alanyl-D-alanine carboxypeptidase/D-alanyl-D-alanine-endopeptidase (penicillin-binding protein 4)